MSDSNRLLVRKAITARLRTIPGIQPESVRRDPLTLVPQPTDNLPILVLGEFEPGTREWQKGGGAEGSLSFYKDKLRASLYGVTNGAGDGEGPKDDAAEALIAAIEVALTTGDYSFGGLVTDLRLQQPLVSHLGLPSQSVVVIEVPLEVTLHRQYGVPV